MCTGVRLNARNGAVVCGRTLEFGQDLESTALVIPRNFQFSGVALNDQKGLQWTSRYAVAGINAFHKNEVIDGVNEAGLAGGLFYFPGFAQYQETAAADVKNSIAPWQLLTWILTQFSTIAEIKKTLPTIKVAQTVYGPWGAIPPVHAIVYEPSGASLVIEYTKAGLNMFDNPLGVITNAPTFDWHLINLRNYLFLSPENVPVKDHAIALGQGSGMLGLPGDFTPPSRFVRAVAFSQSVFEAETEDGALKTLFHILNLFDIPKGVVRDEACKCGDYTQWTSAYDLKNRRYYWHTYDNPQLYTIDLHKHLNATEPILFALEHPAQIIPA